MELKESACVHEFSFNGFAGLFFIVDPVSLVLWALDYMIIIGAGNLGRAIINYADFEKRGFVVRGVFDSNPELEGQVIRDDISIMMMDKLEDFIKNNSGTWLRSR